MQTIYVDLVHMVGGIVYSVLHACDMPMKSYFLQTHTDRSRDATRNLQGNVVIILCFLTESLTFSKIFSKMFASNRTVIFCVFILCIIHAYSRYCSEDEKLYYFNNYGCSWPNMQRTSIILYLYKNIVKFILFYKLFIIRRHNRLGSAGENPYKHSSKNRPLQYLACRSLTVRI